MTAAKRRRTVCNDGTVLTHREAGEGPDPVVLLPGWSQTAEAFAGQMTVLSRQWRVIAIDHRGHGDSSTPDVGYHLSRLAVDLRDVLIAHDLDRVHLLGHSMGCAVIWSYLELFGADRLASLILVDQMPCALRNPAWNEPEVLEAGATMDFAGLFAFTDMLRGDGPDPRSTFLTEVMSPGFDPHQLSRLAEQTSTFDRHHAAELLFDVVIHDWRTLIPRIRLPTLVVAGDSVNVPIDSQRWMGRQIPGARFARVGALQGAGTHFPFLENPRVFDETVMAFLDDCGV
ncbi:MAG: alpha/beta hydrolase [Mycobacterium sp.]|nr:alpha/beta hydrolase [Mycobacterium sp.]